MATAPLPLPLPHPHSEPEAEDALESWDSDADLDFDLPPGVPLLASLPPTALTQLLGVPGLNVSSASLSSGEGEGGSPAPRDEEEGGGFFQELDRRLVEGSEEGEGEKRSVEEENESSISTTATLKGMMEGLSLDLDGGVDEGDRTLSFDPPSPSPPQTSLSADPSVDSTPRPLSKTTTLRPSSSLSTLLSSSLSLSASHSRTSSNPSAGPGRGKVTHLGSTAPGLAREVADGDWDQDLDLGGLSSLGLPVPADDGAGEREREVVRKASFASHLSLGDSEDGFDDSFSAPSAASAPRRKLSIASFSDAGDDDGFDDGFDLPAEQAHLTLAAPLLATRLSLASLRSVGSAASAGGASPAPRSPVPQAATLPVAPAAAAATATTPPAAARVPAAEEDDDGDVTEREDGTAGEDSSSSDEDFFADLVLPSYLGGPGGADGGPPESPSSASDGAGGGGRAFLSTPPTSEGEPDSDHPPPPPPTSLHLPSSASPHKKVDLQQLLRSKLEQRGGRGLLFSSPGPASPGAKAEDERLEKHRERPEEGAGHGELEKPASSPTVAFAGPRREKQQGGGGAKEEEKQLPGEEQEGQDEQEEKWTAAEMRERMRTISGARAREAQLAREARLAGRARTSSSASRFGPGGLRRTMSEGKVPPVPALPASSSRRPGPPARSATASTATRLPRPSSAQSDHPPHSHHPRPPSAASNASSSSGAPRRGPPPPAPSAASRDRVRMRTVSLRTVGSSSDLRHSASGGGGGAGRRPGKLDVPATTKAGDAATGGKRSLSPVPMTPTTPSSASPTTARPTLRTKRSQQLLSTTAGSSGSSISSGRPIERKRSLQNLSALAPSTPSSLTRPSSRQTTTSLSRRSPSPSLTGGRTPSFAAPTASSSSRVRERVQSNPPAPPSPVVPPSPTPASITSAATFSTSSASFGLRTVPSSSNLLRPTFASASKTRPSSSGGGGGSSSRPTSPLKPSLTALTSPSPRSSLPITLSKPLTLTRLPAPLSLARRHSAAGAAAKTQPQPQEYGDGTELDAFDDLPVSKERERERVVSISAGGGAGAGRSASFGSTTSRKSSGASTRTVTPGSGASGGTGTGSWGRKNAATSTNGGSRLPLAPPSSKPGTVRSRKEASSSSTCSTSSASSGARVKGKTAAGAAKEKEKGEKGEKEGKKGKALPKKRREPHLIRHLGGAGAGVKVQNGMTYNPLLHRWEGNESILSEFDTALATSTRPALISPFSSTLGSPARGGFSPSTSPPPSIPEEDKPATAAGATSTKSSRAAKLPAGAANPSASRAGVKVVGDMVFDPTTCSWHALGGQEAEEELELDWGAVTSGGEADEEGGAAEEDGWEAGERERMLRNRASFVLEEGGSSEEDEVARAGGELVVGREGDEEGERRKGKATKRRMWRESKGAEERCRREMVAWVVRQEEGGVEEGEEARRWLWELRRLIVNPQ
ncbi:hypothetical protein JCM6882_005615 [Rhodosporidiobolus microsporus]